MKCLSTNTLTGLPCHITVGPQGCRVHGNVHVQERLRNAHLKDVVVAEPIKMTNTNKFLGCFQLEEQLDGLTQVEEVKEMEKGLAIAVFTDRKMEDGVIRALLMDLIDPSEEPVSAMITRLHRAGQIPASAQFLWIVRRTSTEEDRPIKVLKRMSRTSWKGVDRPLPELVKVDRSRLS